MRIKLGFFCLQMNIKDLFKLILSFSVCVSGHVQISQKSFFAMFLQYFKKEMSDEVDFSHADKYESSLYIDTMMFDGDSQTFPKFPK